MVKAQINNADASEPIQVRMSVEEALNLAYIANDFALSIVKDNPEAERLCNFAAMLSSRVQDCLVARGSMTPSPLKIKPQPEEQPDTPPALSDEVAADAA